MTITHDDDERREFYKQATDINRVRWNENAITKNSMSVIIPASIHQTIPLSAKEVEAKFKDKK